MYNNRVRWLLQASRRVFGVVQGRRVAVLIDTSDANLNFGRLASLKVLFGIMWIKTKLSFVLFLHSRYRGIEIIKQEKRNVILRRYFYRCLKVNLSLEDYIFSDFAREVKCCIAKVRLTIVRAFG